MHFARIAKRLTLVKSAPGCRAVEFKRCPTTGDWGHALLGRQEDGGYYLDVPVTPQATAINYLLNNVNDGSRSSLKDLSTAIAIHETGLRLDENYQASVIPITNACVTITRLTVV